MMPKVFSKGRVFVYIIRLVVDDLEPERQYQFWVTAVTNAGEGMRSDIVVQTPTKRGKSDILQ